MLTTESLKIKKINKDWFGLNIFVITWEMKWDLLQYFTVTENGWNLERDGFKIHVFESISLNSPTLSNRKIFSERIIWWILEVWYTLFKKS